MQRDQNKKLTSYDVNNKVHSGGWLKLEDGVNITSERR